MDGSSGKCVSIDAWRLSSKSATPTTWDRHGGLTYEFTAALKRCLDHDPIGSNPPHPAPGKARLSLANPSQPSPPDRGEREG